MTTDYKADIAHFNMLTAELIAKCEQEVDDRYADHRARVLAVLDGAVSMTAVLVERTREIDRLRAERLQPGKSRDHGPLVADVQERTNAILRTVLALLDPAT